MFRRIAVLMLMVCLAAAAGADQKKPKLRRAKVGAVPNAYIVILTPPLSVEDTPSVAKRIAQTYKVETTHVWENVRAFRFIGAEDNAAQLAEDPLVEFVEQDFEFPAPTPVSGTQWTSLGTEYIWHLDRLDETSWANRDGQYNMCTEGRSVYAYLIDTGVFANHQEFEPTTGNRVVARMDFSADAGAGNTDVTNACTATANPNSNWIHATNTASVLGGTNVGAAKPQIVSLKVMRCGDGFITTTSVISAVNWIRSDKDPYRSQPAVVNYSGYIAPWATDYPGPAAVSTTVDQRIRDKNLPFFTSADNFSTDACQFRPKDRAYTSTNRTGTVFVVGGTNLGGTPATENSDYRWQYYNADGSPRFGAESGSNGGSCVSAYAPAHDIYLAMPSTVSATGYIRRSGTSFSAPLAAGLAARYIERTRHFWSYTPGYQEVYDWLIGQAMATVLSTETTAKWACAGGPNGPRWMTADPGVCNDYELDGDPNRPGINAFFFPATSNTTNARMIYWDEAGGGTCGF